MFFEDNPILFVVAVVVVVEGWLRVRASVFAALAKLRRGRSA
jgi:hypothetical protein